MNKEKKRGNKENKVGLGQFTIAVRTCCDHCPAPFPYFVWQKGYFHPFPLTMGILFPLILILSYRFFFYFFLLALWRAFFDHLLWSIFF